MTNSQELSKLSIREGQVEFDSDQEKALVDVLKVRHATRADMAVFFHQSRRTQLDPFLRQIYMIARQEWDSERNQRVWRQTFQTGIDGFRVVAHRRAHQTGKVLTYEDPVWFDAEGKRYDEWVRPEPPAAVRYVVRLGEGRFPFTARFSEFVVTKDEYEPDSKDPETGATIKGKKTGRKVPQGMWETRPAAQLVKCAEAGALREACPQDLSGVYEFAEMERGLGDGPNQVVDVEATRVEDTTVTSNRDWLAEIAVAETRTQINEIWVASRDAGEQSSSVQKAMADRAAELLIAEQKAKEPVDAEVVEEGTETVPAEGQASTPLDSEATPGVETPAEPTPGVDDQECKECGARGADLDVSCPATKDGGHIR